MPTFSFLYAPTRLTTRLRSEDRHFVARLQNALLPICKADPIASVMRLVPRIIDA